MTAHAARAAATASGCSRTRPRAPASWRPADPAAPPARAGASSRPIHGRRLPGYHSGPVEQLDALEARFSAPKSGRFVVRDRNLSRFSDVRAFSYFSYLPSRPMTIPVISPTRILLALALAAAACVAAPAGAHAFTIGMSDQKLGMWQDPRFEQLGIKQVRLLMSYDSVLQRRLLALRRVDGRGRPPRRRRPADDPAPLAPPGAAADALRSTGARCGSSASAIRGCGRCRPGTRPTTVPADLRAGPGARRSTTTSCARSAAAARIVAADVLDGSNMLPWLATFKRYAKNPRIWGLHSYGDANHFRPLLATGDAAAAARRQGRGLADRGRRDRPLRRPLPRRQARRGARRAARSSTRSRSRARAAGSSASTSTTGTPTRSSSPGTRPSWPRTAARGRRSTSCARRSTASARARAPRCRSCAKYPKKKLPLSGQERERPADGGPSGNCLKAVRARSSVRSPRSGPWARSRRRRRPWRPRPAS